MDLRWQQVPGSGRDRGSARGGMVRRFPGTVFLAAALAVCGCGCATWQPAPLPDAAKLAAGQGPDMGQVVLRAAELEHPLLQPVRLDLSDGLSPEEAAVLAVLANPDLAAVRDARGEAAAQLVGAGLLPDPELSAEVDHPHGAGSDGTVNVRNLGLGMDVGRLVGRAARVAAASAALDAVDLDIAWREWQTAQAARLATVRLGMLERREGILRQQVDAEARTVASLEDAVARGDAAAGDLGVHRAVLEDLRQRRGDLERTVARVRSRLNGLLGLPPGTRLEPSLPDAPHPAPLPPVPRLLDEAVRRRLDLRALKAGYRAQEARVRAAVAARFPSLTIGITAQRNETSLRFLGGFVTLGLPLFDRNQAAIAGERATRARLRDEYAARVARIRADVARIAEEDGLLAAQLERVQEGIAALRPIEAAERKALAAGDASRLAWQQVRSQLLDLELEAMALLQARLELRVALATAIGGEPARQEETR